MKTKRRLVCLFLAMMLTVLIAVPAVAAECTHQWIDDGNCTATCTGAGVQPQVCTVCGSTRNKPVSATGHSWSDNGACTATCTGEGVQPQICTVCGSTRNKPVAATGHSWSDNGACTATCTQAGVQPQICTVCSSTRNKPVAATGLHSWSDNGACTATCTGAGVQPQICTVCGSTRNKPVGALGHTEEIIPGKTATCTEAGLTDGKKCSVCGEILVAQETISVVDHVMVNGKCSVCGYQESGDPYIPPYIPPVFTLVFDTDGGSAISRVTGTYGKVIDLSGYVPTKDGYTFDGWYSDADLTVSITKITLNGNKSIYAKWTENAPIPPIEPDAPLFPFTDVKTTNWSYDDIYYVWEKGLMKGTSDTTFAPNLDISRAVIVTILWRLEGEPIVNYDMSFDDVESSQWYTEAIRWAQSTGIIQGYSTEKFGPNDPITREQMALILYRYAENHSIDVTNANTLEGFTDVDEISTWALDAVKWANAAGLVKGRTTTTLVPEVSISREEAAAMIQRYCENIK